MHSGQSAKPRHRPGLAPTSFPGPFPWLGGGAGKGPRNEVGLVLFLSRNASSATLSDKEGARTGLRYIMIMNHSFDLETVTRNIERTEKEYKICAHHFQHACTSFMQQCVLRRLNEQHFLAFQSNRRSKREVWTASIFVERKGKSFHCTFSPLLLYRTSAAPLRPVSLFLTFFFQ